MPRYNAQLVYMFQLDCRIRPDTHTPTSSRLATNCAWYSEATHIIRNLTSSYIPWSNCDRCIRKRKRLELAVPVSRKVKKLHMKIVVQLLLEHALDFL